MIFKEIHAFPISKQLEQVAEALTVSIK